MPEKLIHILLVEDEQLAADLMIEILEAYGDGRFKICHSPTLASTTECLKNNEIDIILLDLNLPDSLGLDGLKKLKPHSLGSAIIVLTGVNDEDVAAQALKEGAQDFLLKSEVNGPLLLKAIRYAIERKTFQDELKLTHAQMLQNEKMASIGQLAAGVAHEINNPMGFISSNLNSLNKYTAKISQFISTVSKEIEAGGNQQLSAQFTKARKGLKVDFILDDIGSLIEESLDGANRVKQIVQGLRSFSRTDQQEKELSDINQVLENTIKMVWNELKYKTTVIKEFQDLPRTVCFPQQLSQVFMNLLVNAAQAIEKQGEITIRTQNENNSIAINISDTGIGIPPGKQGRIFEPFYTTKEVGKGTGLGLSIVYDIVTQKHNGNISVQSTEGQGTTFTITLPVKSGEDNG